MFIRPGGDLDGHNWSRCRDIVTQLSANELWLTEELFGVLKTSPGNGVEGAVDTARPIDVPGETVRIRRLRTE